MTRIEEVNLQKLAGEVVAWRERNCDLVKEGRSLRCSEGVNLILRGFGEVSKEILVRLRDGLAVGLSEKGVPTQATEVNWRSVVNNGPNGQEVVRLAEVLEKKRTKIQKPDDGLPPVQIMTVTTAEIPDSRTLAHILNVGFYTNPKMRGEVAPMFVMDDITASKAGSAGALWRNDRMLDIVIDEGNLRSWGLVEQEK